MRIEGVREVPPLGGSGEEAKKAVEKDIADIEAIFEQLASHPGASFNLQDLQDKIKKLNEDAKKLSPKDKSPAFDIFLYKFNHDIEICIGRLERRQMDVSEFTYSIGYDYGYLQACASSLQNPQLDKTQLETISQVGRFKFSALLFANAALYSKDFDNGWGGILNALEDLKNAKLSPEQAALLKKATALWEDISHHEGYKSPEKKQQLIELCKELEASLQKQGR